mgnify:CR=1 FL=1
MKVKLFNRIIDFLVDSFKDCKIKKQNKKKRSNSKDVSDK